jgi:SHS2 domain-containing protein
MCAFEVIEHTADVGLRVAAESFEQLLTEAARGVFSLVVENPEAIRAVQAVTLTIESEDVESLFVDWLRELIYRFETEHLLLCEFRVHVSADRRKLTAECRGEKADWSRHLPDNELKAVTYHALRVEQKPNGWEAEVILDI